jgi:arginine N-succinyltransferase
MIIRPIERKDLDALEGLAAGMGVGMTSLPSDRELLKNRIADACESFAAAGKHIESAFFMFVLEDSSSQVMGTCAIKTGIGLHDAFYSYRVSTVVHASRELKVHRQIPTLFLCNDYTGASEIGSLYLAPKYRRGTNGKLLSKCRFLFLAEFPQLCPGTLIAEMRGVSDEDGHSPFWDSLGKHFFAMDFPTADYISGTGNKTFISELMPKQPLYVPLLTPEAQRVIGQVHQQTRPALRMLQQEGFRYAGYIDIFDGGPTIEATLPEIPSVRDSRRLKVTVRKEATGGENYLISNTSFENFRCTLAQLTVGGSDSVVLDERLCRELKIGAGDFVRVVKFR